MGLFWSLSLLTRGKFNPSDSQRYHFLEGRLTCVIQRLYFGQENNHNAVLNLLVTTSLCFSVLVSVPPFAVGGNPWWHLTCGMPFSFRFTWPLHYSFLGARLQCFFLLKLLIRDFFKKSHSIKVCFLAWEMLKSHFKLFRALHGFVLCLLFQWMTCRKLCFSIMFCFVSCLGQVLLRDGIDAFQISK